jgi:hypothetical protein
MAARPEVTVVVTVTVGAVVGACRATALGASRGGHDVELAPFNCSGRKRDSGTPPSVIA